MNLLKDVIFPILIIIGYGAMALSVVSGVGVSLYEWKEGMAFAAAAWEGFVLFLYMFFGGGVVMCIGYFGSK